MKTRGILAELGIPWAFAWLSRSKHREDRPEGQNSLVLWCFTLPKPAPNFPSFAWCCFAVSTTGCDCSRTPKIWFVIKWCTESDKKCMVYVWPFRFFWGQYAPWRPQVQPDASASALRPKFCNLHIFLCRVHVLWRVRFEDGLDLVLWCLVMIQTWSLVTLDDWKCLAHYGSLVPLQILQLSLQRLDFNLSPLYTLAEQLEQMDFCSPCSQANQNPIPSGFLHGFHKAIVWILFQFFLSPKCQVTCGICCTGATLRSDLGGHVFPVPDEVGGLSIGQLRSGVFGTNIGCCMVQIPCYWLS